jgi:hypothetical protein
MLWRLRLRWAAAPLLVIAAFAFGGNVFLDEQTLTGDQQAQLLPGRFDASASLLGLDIPVGKPYLTGIQEVLDAEGIPVTMSLQGPGKVVFQQVSRHVMARSGLCE